MSAPVVESLATSAARRAGHAAIDTAAHSSQQTSALAGVLIASTIAAKARGASTVTRVHALALALASEIDAIVADSAIGDEASRKLLAATNLIARGYLATLRLNRAIAARDATPAPAAQTT